MRNHALLGMTAIAALSLAFAACGGGDDDDAATETATTAATSAATTDPGKTGAQATSPATWRALIGHTRTLERVLK